MREKAPPATLVIFGALGDLTRRLLTPSLLNLAQEELIGDDFRIVGVGHRQGDDALMRQELEGALDLSDEGHAAAWAALRDRLTYVTGDFNDAAMYERLRDHVSGNAAFYFATAPSFFGAIAQNLAKAGLLEEKDGFRRIAVEKPFGHDLASARALNACLLEQVPESQIYRVDHFLGKESVQNILVARFANAMFEAVWNCAHIDYVEISVAEALGVGTRGAFYDATGALRDMVPNHLFQLLALVTMEPPNRFDAESIRDEKARALAAVAPIAPDQAVRGRYTAGKAGDKDLPDYVREADVHADSRTETYAALALRIDNWRWSGVPFYLRTGKSLAHKDSEIVIHFRAAPAAPFAGVEGERPANRLLFQLQPREGVRLAVVGKEPGTTLATTPITLDFCYADRFKIGKRTGYETILYDLLTGDQTLFQRADMIEAGWAAIQPLLEAWGQGAPEDYVAGSTGPAGADALLARDGRVWSPLT
jgi:glucose-6-phosphate 1-dehydrogenase